jgi:hypothetical protein
MTQPLRVGVLGLGQRWQRYRNALLALPNDFEITALYDASFVRTEAHGRALNCARAGGALDLLDREDVDVLLVADRLWWGLWPVVQACRRNKPVFCCPSLLEEGPAADHLLANLGHPAPPVLMADPFAAAPALERLQHLLAEHLGPLSLLRAELALRATLKRAANLLHRSAVAAVVSICLELLGSPGNAVWATADDAGRFATLVLEAGPRLAQVNIWSGPHVTPACRVEVVAEKGTAAALLPRRLRWQDDGGKYFRRMPRWSPDEALLTRFAAAVRGGQPLRPGIAEAQQALACLRAAWQSHSEGRRIWAHPPMAAAKA